MIVVASSSAGSSLMLASGMAESTSMGVVMRFGLRRTLRMEAMAALLVLMVVGLRMAEVLRNVLVVLMFSANLTLVAMCSVVGSVMVAARCAISTLFLETPPAFGLVDTEVFGS